MSVKEKYIAALNDEQAKMVSYVKEMTAKGLRCGSPWIAHQAC